MALKLYIIDEVSAKLEGLPKNHHEYLMENMALMEAGAFMTAAYKSGNWSGKVPLFDENGFFAMYQLDELFGHLTALKYDVDEIEVEDMREPLNHPIVNEPIITKDYLADYGFEFWDHQDESLNAIIQNDKGIIDAATSSGKTLIMAATSYYYDEYYPSIAITLTTKLVKDAAKLYERLGLDYVILDSKKTPKQRSELIKKHRHFITTRKIAINHAEDFEGFKGVISIDEVHQLGDKFHELVTTTFGDCPIRVGFSGSLPEKRRDPLKRQRIFNMIGGGVLKEVLPGYLMEKGHAATLDVRLVEVRDSIGRKKQSEVGDKIWTWDMEEAHYNGCQERIEVIADFIKENCTRNTLIISRPEVVTHIAGILKCDLITGETKEEDREEMFEKFDTMDDYILAASYGTTGTGLSIDLIHYGVLIDIGSNPSVAGQSIGRFLRKDQEGDKKDSAIVYDIYTNMKYGLKQKRERVKYYKERGFSFREDYAVLNV